MIQHRYQAAIEAYQKIDAPSAKVWSTMGYAYQLLSDLNDAVRCYKQSIRIDPRDARIINNLATAYDQLGDHHRAERLYREAIDLGPGSAVYLKNLGTNLLAQHEVQKGSEAYRQALAIDPHVLDAKSALALALPLKDNAEANYAKARTCAQAGLIDCTVDYLRKALDEGSATPARITSDIQFASVRDNPEVQHLLTEQRESIASTGGSRKN